MKDLDTAATDLAIAKRQLSRYRRVLFLLIAGIVTGFLSVVGSIVMSILGIGEVGGPGPVFAMGFLGFLLFIAATVCTFGWYTGHEDRDGNGPAEKVLQADLEYRKAKPTS